MADKSQKDQQCLMCQRVDERWKPPNVNAVDSLLLPKQTGYRHRIDGVGSLAHGETDLVHKLQVVLWYARLKLGRALPGSVAMHKAWRYACRGLCADQGVEKVFVDVCHIENQRTWQLLLLMLQQAVSKARARIQSPICFQS